VVSGGGCFRRPCNCGGAIVRCNIYRLPGQSFVVGDDSKKLLSGTTAKCLSLQAIRPSNAPRWAFGMCQTGGDFAENRLWTRGVEGPGIRVRRHYATMVAYP
jgi:hypothetical protein